MSDRETANEFDIHDTAGEADGGRAARPRMASLLTDEERDAFLTEWGAVQTGFADDPVQATEAAALLVDKVARSVIRQVGAVRDEACAPGEDDPPSDGVGEAYATQEKIDVEALRARLLRCREAFHQLIDT